MRAGAGSREPTQLPFKMFYNFLQAYCQSDPGKHETYITKAAYFALWSLWILWQRQPEAPQMLLDANTSLQLLQGARQWQPTSHLPPCCD